jgi:uncharacterized protein (DUF2062 family)
MSDGFLYKRVGWPVLDLLRQGVTPEKLALSLALGVALGVFPVLGTTTALCALAAFALRLNLPAIQIVNWFVYPLQFALLLPFFRLGEWIFRAPPLPLSAMQIVAMVRASYWHSMFVLWTTTCHAILAWCLTAPVLVVALYVPLRFALASARRRSSFAKD